MAAVTQANGAFTLGASSTLFAIEWSSFGTPANAPFTFEVLRNNDVVFTSSGTNQLDFVSIAFNANDKVSVSVPSDNGPFAVILTLLI